MGFKYNQKSVRLSDEVLEYINSYPTGDNFSQKLENIVLYVCENENSMKERLSFLNSEIDSKLHELIDIKNNICGLRDINMKMDILLAAVDCYVEGVGK